MRREQDRVKDRALLLSLEGRSFGTVGIGTGSWGEVVGIERGQVRGITDFLTPLGDDVSGLAIKVAKPESFFVTKGPIAKKLLELEVEWGKKQAKVGVSPVIGLARVYYDRTTNQVSFLSSYQDGGELAVVMPWFRSEENLLELAGVQSQHVGDLTDNLMKRVKASFVALKEGDLGFDLSDHERVLNLIIDPRMKSYARSAIYPWREQAIAVGGLVEKWFGKSGKILESRAYKGRFGLQHGDPRMQNTAIAGKEAILLDPVRLAINHESLGEKIMNEWWTTDTILQLGMVLGEVVINDWHKLEETIVSAYEREFGDSVEGGELLNIAKIYGLSVEAHVLSYQWNCNELGNGERTRLARTWGKMYELANNLNDGF